MSDAEQVIREALTSLLDNLAALDSLVAALTEARSNSGAYKAQRVEAFMAGAQLHDDQEERAERLEAERDAALARVARLEEALRALADLPSPDLNSIPVDVRLFARTALAGEAEGAPQ
jgi:hypothetical protein